MKLYLSTFNCQATMTAPTSQQIEALLNFLEEHRDLARGSLRSVEGRARSHGLWEEICTTLNAMGGCTKSTKQWQKVWTDKKYLAKKAAAAVRRSASATGGGPSTAPELSQLELKVITIMGDGFGEPQTTARVPAFFNEPSQEPPVLEPSAGPVAPQHEDCYVALQVDVEGQRLSAADPEDAQPEPNRMVQPSRAPRRRMVRQQSFLRANGSLRERLIRFEEDREQRETRIYEALEGIRAVGTRIADAVEAMQRLMQQFIERNLN